MDETDQHVLTGVGARLRALRRARGTSLTALAQRTGLSASTLSRLENGKRRPTLEQLLPLAREGYEWFSVLNGHVTFVLRDRVRRLGPGEAAEFDTRVPHWLGSAGEQPAELLTLIGVQGERLRPAGSHPPGGR